MINKTTLTQLVNQSMLTKYAALPEEDKAALLTSKQNFLQGLKEGDLLEGVLLKGNGQNILLQLKIGLQLSAILQETLPENLSENTKLQFIVKAMEGEKLQLALRQTVHTETALIVDKVTTALNLPRNEVMVSLIDTFTQFELPLDRKLLTQTYEHVQTTKLPREVLVNLLNQFKLNTEEAFEMLKDFNHNPLQKATSSLLEGCLESIKGNTQLANQLVDALIPFIPEKEFNAYYKMVREGESNPIFVGQDGKQEHVDRIEQVFSAEYTRMEKFIKMFSKSLCTISYEDLQKDGLQGHLKNQLAFKDSECLKELIKTIKSFPELPETVSSKVAEIEAQLPIWQKLNEQGHYFAFPWMAELGEAKGEVYFYKPKKEKKNNTQDFYTVIALDMPYLNHIEAHIHQIGKVLEVTLYTSEEQMRDMINGQLTQLVYLLENAGYQLSKCSCQMATLTHLNKPFIRETESKPICGIDFKI